MDRFELCKRPESISKELIKSFPGIADGRLRNFAAQVNQFINVMSAGDLVVSPLKTTGQIAIGEIVGDYQPYKDGRPARKVKWMKTDVSRDVFKQDLLYSFGAIMTVCEIKRNDALNRVLMVAKTGRDAGDGALPNVPVSRQEVDDEPTEPIEPTYSLDQIARDQIQRRISSIFTGHEFTKLVAAILEAQGYETHMSPPGPDSGIDIVAGQGALGFGAPRLVVQVKSGDLVVDQPTLQSLIGCVHDAQADHGLLVSWGGFKPTVRRRTNELFFRVRLWGRDEVIDAIFANYDQLSEVVRAELPLRRTWTLVADDQEDNG